jgi:transcriptional regulator with XRE-family HTH domain
LAIDATPFHKRNREVVMKTQIDIRAFVAMLKTKRGERGLREVAQAMGEISASTLSRIENGKPPEMDVFLRICDWMQVDPATFLTRADEDAPKMNTPEVIEAHLRADKNLDEATAEAIAQMVRTAYELNRKRYQSTDNDVSRA